MYYLALDQALQCSGFAVFNDNKLEAGGTLKTNATYPIEVRLGSLGTQLDKILEDYNIEHVFFEDIQKQTNIETYKKLCYVQALVMLWCGQHHMKFNILAPSHGRKILKEKYKIQGGKKREEQKKAALKGVRQTFDSGANSFDNDSADAICIGVAGRIEQKQNESAG